MADSYASGSSTTPLLGETIGDNLDAAAQRFAEREALVVCHQDVRWTYAELRERADRLARALIAAGLERCDRVGIWAPNCAEWVLVQYATAKAGIVLVNLNPAYRTSELEYALNQSGCRVLVAAQSFKTSDYVAMVGEVRPRCEALERVVFLESPTSGTSCSRRPTRWPTPTAPRARPGCSSTTRSTSSTRAAPPAFPRARPSRTTTSSTTASSWARAAPTPRRTASASRCRSTTASAWSWATSARRRTGRASSCRAPAFEPAAALRAVQEERCTCALRRADDVHRRARRARASSYDLSSLRTGIMAGSPCPVEVMRRVIDRMNMTEVTICYGMTETSPVSTQTGADDEIERRVGHGRARRTRTSR